MIQRKTIYCKLIVWIYVDASKSIANQAKLPHQALPALESAAATLHVVHGNTSLREALRDVTTDHKGREHHFDPEMSRDTQKTLSAASVLYDTSTGDDMVALGEHILQETYASLPDNHPTKPLIGVEMQLSRAARGEKPNFERLREDFEALRASDEESNPHRVATVASWLTVWGEKLGDQTVEQSGREVFDRLTRRFPEWNTMLPNERQKIAVQKARKRAFRAMAPVTTSRSRRTALHEKLTSR